MAEKHETDVPSTLICARHNNPTGVEDFKIFNVGGVKIAVIG